MRLFVAVRPPAAVRATLLAAMGGIAAARWQDDDQLHLTLRFIGDADRNTAADLVAALAAVHHPPIAARLGAIGSFATRGRPNAVWIGVEPAAALTTLHHKVDQAVVRAGIAPDTRAFVPHITLARLGRDAGTDRRLHRARGSIGGVRCVRLHAVRECAHPCIAAVYRPLADFTFAGNDRYLVNN